MPRKLIIILVAVAVLIGLWYGWRWWSSRPIPVVAVNTNQEQPPSPIQPVSVPPASSPAASADRAVQVAAMTFAERYGTYSTDAPYENLKRLTTLVTASFAAELQASINQGALPGAGGFYGVTTRALSAAITSASENLAAVKVAVQRQESTNRQGTPTLSYTALNLTLDRSNGAWLVSGARWEK